MGKIKITQISINIPVQIGAMSEKKKLKLDEFLLKIDVFNKSMMTPIGLLYVSQNNDQNLIINQDRITYTKAGYKIEDKIEDKITTIIGTIFETLMLDENIVLIIDIQGLSESVNSHLSSKQKFNSKFNNILDDSKNIYGVGYRFLVNDKEITGEFKVEPLINDNSKYFYQYIINTKNVINIKNLLENVNKEIVKMNNSFVGLINKIE